MLGIGILGKIFGSEKTLSKIVDGVSSGLDKLTYTSEEKAQDAAKQREKARDQVVAFMEATKGQNIARRLIAFIMVSIWSICYVTSLGMIVASVFVTGADLVERLKEGAGLIDAHISDIEYPLMLILAFYFGAPHVENVIASWTSRTKKS